MDNGALLTAIMGASIATLGIVVAKDTKVSEFRQQWIDALRTDVSRFSALATSLWNRSPGYHSVSDHAAASNLAKEDVELELETVAYRIVLRLDIVNKDKKDKAKIARHKKLLELMSEVRTMAPQSRVLLQDLHISINTLNEATAELLDEAWEKAKRGEKNFGLLLRLLFRVCCSAYYRTAFRSRSSGSKLMLNHARSSARSVAWRDDLNRFVAFAQSKPNLTGIRGCEESLGE